MSFNNLYNNPYLSDFYLELEDRNGNGKKVIEVHRIILTQIPYFEKLFKSGAAKVYITFPEVEDAIKFAYGIPLKDDLSLHTYAILVRVGLDWEYRALVEVATKKLNINRKSLCHIQDGGLKLATFWKTAQK